MSGDAPVNAVSVGGQGARRDLVAIQYLRALAAIMVVVFHLVSQLRRMGYSGYWPMGLSSGVDIFFVISGLIMWVTTSGRRIGVLDFWRRRLTRIVPLYWLLSTVAVLVMLIAPHQLQTARFELHHVVFSYLFIPSMHPVLHSLEPIIIPGWTLNYEMFFYLIFGLWLLVPEKFRFAGVGVVILALVMLGVLTNASSVRAEGFYTSSIMLEFLIGIGLGVLITQREVLDRLKVPLAWLLLAIGLLLAVCLPMAYPATARVITRGLPSGLIVAATIGLELNQGIGKFRWGHLLGDASYSLYLVQFWTLAAFSLVWNKLFNDGALAMITYCVCATIGTVIAGVLCHLLIEKRLTALFQSINQNRKSEALGSDGYCSDCDHRRAEPNSATP